MKTKVGIRVAAIALLIGAAAVTSGVSRASTPSSPAERAATAELNRSIMLRSAAADDQKRLMDAQYQEQMRQYEAKLQQNQAQQQQQDQVQQQQNQVQQQSSQGDRNR